MSSMEDHVSTPTLGQTKLNQLQLTKTMETMKTWVDDCILLQLQSSHSMQIHNEHVVVGPDERLRLLNPLLRCHLIVSYGRCKRVVSCS